MPTPANAAPQLFNWVIDAACAAGNVSAAKSAFDRMCQAGVGPTPATFAALLGALRHDHSVAALADLALALAEQADGAAAGASAGTRPAALHALLQACSLRGWWDLSMRLLQALEESGASPSVEEVNEALAACATAGAVDDVSGPGQQECARFTGKFCHAGGAACLQEPHALPALAREFSGTPAQMIARLRSCTHTHSALALVALQARQLFEGLGARGLQPTTASYLALVKALCTAGQWAAGAAEYEAMLAAG